MVAVSNLLIVADLCPSIFSWPEINGEWTRKKKMMVIF